MAPNFRGTLVVLVNGVPGTFGVTVSEDRYVVVHDLGSEVHPNG